MKNSITVMQLVEIQRKAMRRRVWFKVLERTERAILQLTILCVNRIRSPKLTKIVKDIVVKLKEAMKGRVKKLTKLGRKLALDLSQIALNWGNVSAIQWPKNQDFIQYLTVIHINAPRHFLV